jgi:hypothetical protein
MSLASLSPGCKKWIGFGIFIRLLIIPWSGHPDVFYVFGTPFLFLNDGIFDIYQHMADYFSDPAAAAEYSYQPLHYFIFGLWSGITQLFANPEYSIWMPQVIDQFPSILRAGETAFYLPGAEAKFKVLFLWKTLYLICDFLILFFVLKIIGGEKEKESYISWWAGSVVLLYSEFLFGQCGIVPVTIIIAGIYFYKVKKSAPLLGLCFALSVPFKLFTLVLLPIPFLLAKGLREKIKTSCWILFPLLVVYLPFIIHSGSLVLSRIIGALGVSYSEGLAWGWVLILSKSFKVLGFLAVFYHAGFRYRGDFENVLRYAFICFLLLLCLPLKIHYYVWVTPFWFLFFHKHRKYAGIYCAIVFLLFFANLSDKATFLGVLAPLAPDFFMSFPGWMDITYFFSPSGFHAKIATLIIFILSALVVVHQLFILFDLNPGFFQKPDVVPIRKTGVILVYPAIVLVFVAVLFSFSHPMLKTQLKDFLFTRSLNFYYEPQISQVKLASGASLNQELSLLKGRIKKAGLFLDQSIDSAVRVEILEIQGGEEKQIFVKDLPRLEKGWVESIPQPYFVRDKKVQFRLTNTSTGSINVSAHRRPKYAKGFQLTRIPKDEGVEIIDGGVLRMYVQEEPRFLHDSGLPFRSIKQAMVQERNFLVFWFLLLTFCGMKTLQYRKSV